LEPRAERNHAILTSPEAVVSVGFTISPGGEAFARQLFATLLALSLVAGASGVAQAEDWYGKRVGGGNGGSFAARCDQGEYLVGLEARAGDWFDAIRPLCATPGGSMRRYRTQFGGDGGAPRDETCPADAPVVTYLGVIADGAKTVVVDHLEFRCGIHAANQAPVGQRPQRLMLSGCSEREIAAATCGSGDGRPNRQVGSSECPVGMLGVGVYGRYGIWLDARGLICAEAPRAAPAPWPPPVSGTPMPDCPYPKEHAIEPPHECVCPVDRNTGQVVDYGVCANVSGVITQDDLKRLPKDIFLDGAKGGTR
jgi:hypothetical protein